MLLDIINKTLNLNNDSAAVDPCDPCDPCIWKLMSLKIFHGRWWGPNMS